MPVPSWSFTHSALAVPIPHFTLGVTLRHGVTNRAMLAVKTKHRTWTAVATL